MTVGPGSTLTHLEFRKSGERGCLEKGKEEARRADHRLQVSHLAAVQDNAVSGDQPCSLTAWTAGQARPGSTRVWLGLSLPGMYYLCPQLWPEFDPLVSRALWGPHFWAICGDDQDERN